MSNSPYEKKKSVKNGVGRLVLTICAGLVQICFFVLLLIMGNKYWSYLDILLGVVSLIVTLFIVGQARTSSLKIPWIILLLALPGFGLLMYLFLGITGNYLGVYKRYERSLGMIKPFRKTDEGALNNLKEADVNNAGVANYLQKRLGYGLYDNSDITYFRDTTDCMEDMLANLEKAEKFIFMEYYAIEDSAAFGRYLEVLERKVKEGVMVRVFYDDLGSVSFVDLSFAKKLKSKGIDCRSFNPFFGSFNAFLHKRDHRKIMVIDGKVGYTGGFNLADEYFHLTEPYGYWKDTAVKLEGEAVSGLTMIFLENWNALKKGKESEGDSDITPYLPKVEYTQREKCFIQPYADSPTDNIQSGENVYLSVVEKANDFIYISTPYLIISDEMVSALAQAARRGVDVKVITPGVPDKKLIYSMTRSYYHILARDGVRIFEYTPGFNHAKMCVADDKVATCGTFNMDYRSMYHNFEDGCIFYHCDAVIQERKDLEEMLSVSREVTDSYSGKNARILRAGQAIIRLFAPLL